MEGTLQCGQPETGCYVASPSTICLQSHIMQLLAVSVMKDWLKGYHLKDVVEIQVTLEIMVPSRRV
jgi:hypothetical protein